MKNKRYKTIVMTVLTLGTIVIFEKIGATPKITVSGSVIIEIPKHSVSASSQTFDHHTGQATFSFKWADPTNKTPLPGTVVQTGEQNTLIQAPALDLPEGTLIQQVMTHSGQVYATLLEACSVSYYTGTSANFVIYLIEESSDIDKPTTGPPVTPEGPKPITPTFPPVSPETPKPITPTAPPITPEKPDISLPNVSPPTTGTPAPITPAVPAKKPEIIKEARKVEEKASKDKKITEEKKPSPDREILASDHFSLPSLTEGEVEEYQHIKEKSTAVMASSAKEEARKHAIAVNAAGAGGVVTGIGTSALLLGLLKKANWLRQFFGK